MRMSRQSTTRKNVRVLLGILTIVLFAMVRLVFAADNRPFSIIICTAHPQAKLGEAIPLTVSLTNVFQRDIKVSQVVAEKQAQLDYKIQVVDSRGMPVKFKKGALTMPGDGSIAFIVLQPGQEHTEYASLDSLFDISEPGAYKVEVTREVPSYLGEGQVKSNVLVITILK